MENTIILSILEKDSTIRKELSECVSMHFTKERYTPYSTFNGTFAIEESIGEIIDIEVTVNNVLIHKGVVDTSEIKRLSTYTQLSVKSRGYTFALGYNEMRDGIRYGLTLDEILTQDVVLPNITYESGTSAVNYLYVKKHTSVWDAIVNLCLKSKNTHPYIRYPNMIRFTKHENPQILNFTSMEDIISFSDGNDLSKVISHINMKDTEGSYDTYYTSSQFALDRNIIRHKYIDFDKQWVNDPIQGLQYRLNYARRGSPFSTIIYKGYNGEDLHDCFSIDISEYQKPQQYISKIDIMGSKKGIITKLTAYNDAYNN